MKNLFKSSLNCVIFLVVILIFPHSSKAVIVINPPGGSLCTGLPLTFLATGGAPGTYTWSANSSTTASAVYTIAAPGSYSITVTDHTGASASGTFSINASPTADAGNGYNLKCIPGISGALALGGSPTGPTGATYLWTLTSGTGTFSSTVAANPTVTGYGTSGINTYNVAVSLSGCTTNSSTDILTQIFEEQLDGPSTSSSYGRVVSDMTVDNQGLGMLYSAGWYNTDMYNQKGPNQNPLLSTASGHGDLYVMKHNPCDDNALIWFHNLSDYQPDCGTSLNIANATSEVTHPFTPNIAQTADPIQHYDLFVSFNVSGAGDVARYTTAGALVNYGFTKGLTVTDIKADDRGRVYLTGYGNGTQVGGGSIGGSSTTFGPGEIFIALIDQTYTTGLKCVWATSTGLVTGGSTPGAAPASIGTVPGANFIFVNTGNKLYAYTSAAGTLVGTGGGLGSATDPTTRVATLGTASSGSVYGVDGTNLYGYTYSVLGSVVTITATGQVHTAVAPNYDVKTHAASGTVYVITYSTLEAFVGSTLAPVSTYGSSGAFAYLTHAPTGTIPYSPHPCANNDGADRCLAIETTYNKEMFIGGSMPISSSLVATSPFNFTPTVSAGFLTRLLSINGGGTGALYKTNEGDDEATPLAATPAAATGYSIYPNPTRGQLSIIVGTDEAEASYAITGVDGRLMMSGTILGKGEVNTISTEALSAGIYMIQVRSAGQVHTQKIVKQ